MGSFGTAFLVEGSGSTLTVSDVICNNNRLKDAYDAKFSRNFNLVIAMDETTANENNVEFGNNDGVDVSNGKFWITFILYEHALIETILFYLPTARLWRKYWCSSRCNGCKCLQQSGYFGKHLN